MLPQGRARRLRGAFALIPKQVKMVAEETAPLLE